jgi:Family of unknown function (DUF5317)
VVLLDFVVAGLVVGLLLGGSPQRLASLRVRFLWLAYAAIALQVAAFPSGVLPWSMPPAAASGLWLASYAALTALIVANLRIPGLALVGVGQACNLVAILANHGLMPVTRGALDGAGLSYHLRNNSLSVVHPHLAWLVDRWAVPAWLPLGNVYSIGDVAIGIGVLATVVIAMRPRLFTRTRTGPQASSA